MARRRIGQEDLIARREPRSASSLSELAALLDWREIDRHLAGISAAAKGEAGWPPLALFRGLLLATWHDLSNVRLAEALDDRASFRRFCGFAAHEPTPERTAFVRFRRELVRHALDRALFEAVTRQLGAKGVAVRSGTLVDATLIPSASIRRDDETRWAGHRRRKPTHDYKAHVATDEGTGLVHGVEVTTTNVQDAAKLAAVLPDDPGEVYGDSAFGGTRSANAIQAKGGVPAVVGTGTWGGPAALARLQAHNARVRRVRCRIYRSRDQARADVFDYIERFYHPRRRHSTIGYLSPMEFEALAEAG
ncbi:IS5 family transposase [Roseomonas sp. CAU 1739]|uniref:IS5 family transposase n=1 Tax=Roseomonas sp. CAU 1739 TaxID=3140364 RepID=UPI00325B914C